MTYTAVHVRDQVARLLSAELPRRLVLLRRAWRLDADTLPEPEVLSGRPASDALTSKTKTWCNVLAPRDIAPLRRVDIDSAGFPVYEGRWGVQVEIWCLGDDWDVAQQAAGHLTGAVRDALLEYPGLTIGDDETNMALHPDTLVTQYGQIIRGPSNSSRSWAPGMISADVRTESGLRDGSSVPEPAELTDFDVHITHVGAGRPYPPWPNDPPRVYPTNLQ